MSDTVTSLMQVRFLREGRGVFRVEEGRRILDVRHEWSKFLDHLERRLFADLHLTMSEPGVSVENAKVCIAEMDVLPGDHPCMRRFRIFEAHPATVAAYRRYCSQ